MTSLNKKISVLWLLSIAAVICLLAVLIMPSFAVTVHVLLGDVNDDQAVNTGDAVLILRYASDLITFDNLHIAIADANENDIVNTGDATYVLRITVGLEQEKWVDVDNGIPTPIQTSSMPSPTPTPSAPLPTQTPTPNGYDYVINYVYGILDNPLQTVTGKADAGMLNYTALSPLTLLNASDDGNERGFVPENHNYMFEISATKPNVFYIYCNEVFQNEDGRDGSSWATAYIIRKTADLTKINTYAGLNSYYIMGDDIDLSSYATWVPIGTYDRGFSGGFDGYGYAITDMTVTSPVLSAKDDGYAGFFGSLNTAIVRNMTIVDAVIDVTNGNHNRMYTGVIVGSSFNSDVVNCHTSGVIKTNAGPGGTGGVIGSTWHSGMGGMDSSKLGSIQRCSSSAAIESEYSMVGGIVGAANMPITQCWFDGSAVSASGTTGGIVGYYSSRVAEYLISNCWTAGLVQGKQNGDTTGVGGIAGYATQAVYACYSVARVNSLTAVNASTPYCQPLVGSALITAPTKDSFFLKGNFCVNGTLNTYWDNGGSGLRGSGYTMMQMTDPKCFSTWDNTVWTFDSGTLPVLTNNE